MDRYLVKIEFRYNDAPRFNSNSTFRSETLSISIHDDFEQACESGNKLLELMESMFPIHKFPDGREAQKERFKKKGFLGHPDTLVTNLAYLKTPFEFYAKIETLKFRDTELVIDDIVECTKKYRKFKLELDQE